MTTDLSNLVDAVDAGCGAATDPVLAAASRLRVLTARLILLLGTVVSVSSLVTALADHAASGQVGLGVVLTAAWCGGALRPEAVVRVLAPSGRAILLLGAVAAGIALAGTWNSPYVPVENLVVALGVVFESPRRIAGCVLLAVAGYLGGLLAQGYSLGALEQAPYAGTIAVNSADFATIALILLATISVTRRLMADLPLIVAGRPVGFGPPTAALAQALIDGEDTDGCLALPKASPAALVRPLTDTERQIVAALAAGRHPKQLAHDRGVSLATVRAQLRSAKRKTGARTLEQLVAFLVEAGGLP